MDDLSPRPEMKNKTRGYVNKFNLVKINWGSNGSNHSNLGWNNNQKVVCYIKIGAIYTVAIATKNWSLEFLFLTFPFLAFCCSLYKLSTSTKGGLLKEKINKPIWLLEKTMVGSVSRNPYILDKSFLDCISRYL
jgi:hypothetical protein